MLASEHILIYGGTFDGFLSCVFHCFELKIKHPIIQKENEAQNSLFGEMEFVPTDATKADRVWTYIKSKSNTTHSSKLYYAFLSELPNIENDLLGYIKYAVESSKPIGADFSNPYVLKVSQVAKMVGREKHRMEAFIRFKLTKDDLYFANVSPDFNVLPLISKHFKSRYADQRWVIYDIPRQYGLFYDLKEVNMVNMEFPEDFDFTKTPDSYFADEELEFQQLWKDYFNSTNIPSRKNIKLHVRHVPKRYWKYLSEKL